MKLSLISVAVVLTAAPAFAQRRATSSMGAVPGVYAYPLKGQDTATQNADQAACRQWATNQTGVDPMAMQTPAAPRNSTGAGAMSGAARGAVGGLVVGSVVGRPRRGAMVGTTVGAVSGHRSARRANEQQQAAAVGAQMNQFQRAYAACMGGRGYNVD